MNTKDFETLGFYEPGLLHLRINTDLDISDLNNLSTDEARRSHFSTFLHEYIHFLQEVSSTAGLMTASFYIDFIKEANQTVRNDGVPEFQVPLVINNDNNIEVNLKLRLIYSGDNEIAHYAKFDRYEVTFEEVEDKDGNKKSVPRYKIFYYDKSARSRSFYFGTTCLKEFVAHAVQQKYIPETSHPDIPYKIAELIVQKEYPPLGEDPMNVVALCDASLMSFYPAQMFFNTLQRMKENLFVPTSPKEIYDFSFQDLKYRSDQLGEFTVQSLFEKKMEIANQQFYDALQSPPFLPNYSWIKHILTNAKELRLSRPAFMTELVESQGKLSPLFYKIFNVLGSPFFTNSLEIGGFVPPNDLHANAIPHQPYQLRVFSAIIKVYMGEKKCSMYDFCKARPDKDITNMHCTTAPWERAKDADLCPFGQLWRTWGLIGEIPVGVK